MNEELIKLLTLTIPSPSTVEDGFLEITRQAHRETVNSNIYAYFLDPNHQKSIADLFLHTLLELIESKVDAPKKLSCSVPTIYTEVTTKNRKRIDLVIEDDAAKEVIIIENKLFHHLHNDLLEYWEHYAYKAINKVGVLLKLEAHDIPTEVSDKFINITHKEWIVAMKKKGLPTNIPSKFYVYLNDFFQTIEQLTSNYLMNEQASFYFKHAEKIQELQQTIHEGNQFMEGQIQLLASKLNLDVYGKSMEWRNFWNAEKVHYTYYTLIFDDIMNGGDTIQIIIELFREDIDKADDLRKLVTNNEGCNSLYQQMETRGDGSNNYLHFAWREYKISSEEIGTLAKFVYQKIEKDFKPVMDVMIEYLYPEDV